MPHREKRKGRSVGRIFALIGAGGVDGYERLKDIW